MALRDERLALHWIQENIGAFGGLLLPSDPLQLPLTTSFRRSDEGHYLG